MRGKKGTMRGKGLKETYIDHIYSLLQQQAERLNNVSSAVKEKTSSVETLKQKERVTTVHLFSYLSSHLNRPISKLQYDHYCVLDFVKFLLMLIGCLIGALVISLFM